MELLEIPWYVSVLLTLLTSGVLFQIGSSVYFRRQKRLKETGDAISASSGTVDSVTSVSDAIANRYEAAMEKRFKMQEMYYEERERRMELESRIRILENGQRAAEYDRAENRRKILGLQRKLDEMISRTTFAETNICFRDPCPIREPKKGTYNGEKKEAQEIQTKEGNESIAG